MFLFYRLFFRSYTLPLFYRGYKNDIEVTDLPESLKEHKSSRLGDRLEAAWNAEEERAKKEKRTPSLRRVLMRVFGLEFLFYGIVLAFSEFAIK